MKPDEMMADLPEGCEIGLSERLLLRYLADHAHDAQLEDGSYLCESKCAFAIRCATSLEPSKIAIWLRQSLEATRTAARKKGALPEKSDPDRKAVA
jgi:hypothetical protein